MASPLPLHKSVFCTSDLFSMWIRVCLWILSSLWISDLSSSLLNSVLTYQSTSSGYWKQSCKVFWRIPHCGLCIMIRNPQIPCSYTVLCPEKGDPQCSDSRGQWHSGGARSSQPLLQAAELISPKPDPTNDDEPWSVWSYSLQGSVVHGDSWYTGFPPSHNFLIKSFCSYKVPIFISTCFCWWKEVQRGFLILWHVIASLLYNILVPRNVLLLDIRGNL